ncbi:MAG: queuosine precursor transporter [Deltaproteobacteria bacterium]|nr:queuosine precursor transporter [Deltaproteobacteria bacterium]
MENAPTVPTGETRYLGLITGLFAGFLLISNLASTRIVQIGFLSFDAGALMFPMTYIFGDLLTEVYGFQKSRQVIWIGFLTLALATVLLYLASLFPPAPGWEGDAAWHSVMGLVPRLAMGSLVAYLIGEFANSMTLAKMKAKAPDKPPAIRFVVSTLVGQFFDTFLFTIIAFFGVLESGLWWKVVGSNYLFKVGVEVLLLPLTLIVVRRLKKAEKLDAVDKDISYNPFRWREIRPKNSSAESVSQLASPISEPNGEPSGRDDRRAESTAND